MNRSIDAVVSWVDGDDPAWRKIRDRYWRMSQSDERSNDNIRFQNWNNLHYWVKAVKTFMPWIRRIFIVTWGHIPEKIDINDPKIQIVRHDEFIPSEYLPTFNSNVIEWNYHRIPGLSENFILFCDDMIPIQPIEEEYYFKENTVCDEAVENVIVAAAFGPVANMARYTQVNNMMVINKYFRKREVQAKSPQIWTHESYGELQKRTDSLCYWNDFPGIHDPHMANAMKKSTIKEIWEKEPDLLNETCRHRFRDYRDVTQSLIRYWQICKGTICPRKTLGKVFYATLENVKEIADGIRDQRWQMICINEDCEGQSFLYVRDEINKALSDILD